MNAYFDSEIAKLNPQDAQEFNAFIENKGFSPMDKTLVKGIIVQLGGVSGYLVAWRDVVKKGADAGFKGFDNDHDRNKLFQKNQERILNYAIKASDNAGQLSVSDFIHSYYQSLNEYQNLNFSSTDIAERLYNPEHSERHIIVNIMAWFVLENLAYSYGEYLKKKAA